MKRKYGPTEWEPSFLTALLREAEENDDHQTSEAEVQKWTGNLDSRIAEAHDLLKSLVGSN